MPKEGGGLITLIRDNIKFTTTDIPSTINTHDTELQMVKVHINNTKHIIITNIYIPPRDSTATHYKTTDNDIQHYIQYITNIPHSVLTGHVNAHSTLWLSYTDDHRGQLIADVISNSDHITLNTNTPTRVPNTTLQQTSSPDITTVSNTLYKTQESVFDQTNIHTANIIFTNIILMAGKHNIPKGKMHSNCMLVPDHIVYKITQRNNIRRANTCAPVLKLLNEEITSDIQKHKQNLWKEHLDAHWDHRHILLNTIHGLSNRASPYSTHTKHFRNIQQQTNILQIVSPNNSRTPTHNKQIQ